MNRLEQTEQLNFFSPVWVRLCLESSSDRENLLSQPGHWQENGFSPVEKTEISANFVTFVAQSAANCESESLRINIVTRVVPIAIRLHAAFVHCKNVKWFS